MTVHIRIPKIRTGHRQDVHRLITILRDDKTVFSGITTHQEVIPVKAEIGSVIKITKTYKGYIDWTFSREISRQNEVISVNYVGQEQ